MSDIVSGRRFTVVLTPEPDGSAYNVSVPSLPGCVTWGSTVEVALEMAKDAIKLFLEGEDLQELLGDGQSADSIVATVTV
jgi:predicted RNase H-like HicB family nuclease